MKSEPWTWTALASACLRRARYRARRRELEAEFTSGRRYRYRGVPLRVFRELLAAESKGRYFQRHIRGRFPYRRSAV